MMTELQKVSFDELEANFDHYFDRVCNGETFLIEDRGVVFAPVISQNNHDRRDHLV